MAKISIARIYDLSKVLLTKAGAELEEPFRYLSEFAENSLRALRNGLTFEDNFDAEVKQIRTRQNLETVVAVNQRKRVTRIYVDRVVQPIAYYQVEAFGWKYDERGQLVVKVALAGNPPSNLDLVLNLVIHFG